MSYRMGALAWMASAAGWAFMADYFQDWMCFLISLGCVAASMLWLGIADFNDDA